MCCDVMWRSRRWGHLNVRCNAIAYGWIDTRLTRAKEGGEAIMVAGEKVRCHCQARVWGEKGSGETQVCTDECLNVLLTQLISRCQGAVPDTCSACCC